MTDIANVEEVKTVQEVTDNQEAPKRKRGRPRKLKAPEMEDAKEVMSKIAVETKVEETDDPEATLNKVTSKIIEKAKEEEDVARYKLAKELEDDIAKSKRAQARRLETPEITISNAVSVRQKEIIKEFCPEGVGPNAEFHPFFGDRSKHKDYISQGYEPCVDRGEQIISDGDPLYKLPMALYKQQLKAASIRSNKMVNDTEDAATRDGKKASVITEDYKILKHGDEGFMTADVD